MDTPAFEYWRPGSEERQLRIFISHRFGRDEELYDKVVRALEGNRFSVQDMSLSATRLVAGPRGGALPKLTLQAEIAARIYTSDALIAPSGAGITKSDWVSWEVQLAAIGYGLPILFVNEKGQRNRSRWVRQIEELDLPHAICERDSHKIVENLIKLIDGRPYWGVRQDEPDEKIKFRGPPAFARTKVLTQYPFRARLPPRDFEPPPRRGFWSFLSGDQRPS